jgi:hypothetical protein
MDKPPSALHTFPLLIIAVILTHSLMVAIGLMVLVIVQMGGVSTVHSLKGLESPVTNMSSSLAKLALMEAMLVWLTSS